MKYFILLLLVFTATLHAQNPKPAEKKVNDFAPNQREFFNLPEEKRKEFIKHYDDAIRFFADKRVFETLDALDEAEKVFSKSMELHNMRGSCYIEMRIFDKANISFNKALEISPNNLNLKFNIAECFFVSKKWQDSHDKFQELVKILPPNSGDIFRLADKYNYQDDSPYYYYAKAALAFDDKDLVAAEKWMGRAARIFRDPRILSPWQDTMMEYGYIKGFLGGQEEEVEAP
jgi:tetratricopeptide (TPR) repeat protein